VEADVDSRVWEILGRLVFPADFRTSSAPAGVAPLAGSRVEADDDSRVWEIMGQMVF
jgi:hypothetical protein